MWSYPKFGRREGAACPIGRFFWGVSFGSNGNGIERQSCARHEQFILRLIDFLKPAHWTTVMGKRIIIRIVACPALKCDLGIAGYDILYLHSMIDVWSRCLKISKCPLYEVYYIFGTFLILHLDRPQYLHVTKWQQYLGMHSKSKLDELKLKLRLNISTTSCFRQRDEDLHSCLGCC